MPPKGSKVKAKAKAQAAAEGALAVVGQVAVPIADEDDVLKVTRLNAVLFKEAQDNISTILADTDINTATALAISSEGDIGVMAFHQLKTQGGPIANLTPASINRY